MIEFLQRKKKKKEKKKGKKKEEEEEEEDAKDEEKEEETTGLQSWPFQKKIMILRSFEKSLEIYDREDSSFRICRIMHLAEFTFAKFEMIVAIPLNTVVINGTQLLLL